MKGAISARECGRIPSRNQDAAAAGAPAVGLVSARSSGVMRSAVSRLRLLRSTWKRKPWNVKAWPGSGMMRASWMTSPATVVASSSGSVQPVARFRSRIGDRAVARDRAVGQAAHAFDRSVVLVGDVADDLLDDVFQRHQPLHVAVFVDDEGEVRLALQERAQLIVEAGGLGDEPRLLRDLHDVEGRRGRPPPHAASAGGPWRGRCRRCSPASPSTPACACTPTSGSGR